MGTGHSGAAGDWGMGNLRAMGIGEGKTDLGAVDICEGDILGLWGIWES